ncbi:MBL fold metallo-hydrolase [Dactylosporangium sp. McL0621]|uniref:MBL fold metallo-hydrolase n=1 Tax=Dactylosporangium sp. McL0621 TaxID=3415678 RepID=UPI003CEE4A5D
MDIGETVIEIGETRVEFVVDGEVRGAAEEFFPGSDWGPHRHLLDPHGNVVARVGAFLVRTSSDTILIDAGLGRSGNETEHDGALIENLRKLMVAPEEVDLVVLTHLHRDHVGWVGAFPRARYAVDQREWDYWSDRPGGVGPDPDRVLAHIEQRRERLDHPHLHAIPTPGHTPGHTSVLVTNGSDRRLLVLGDLVHTRAQMDEPDWRFRSDVDADEARRSRKAIFQQYRDGRTVLAAAHVKGPVA